MTSLYPRWILANALAETLGLGSTFAMIAWLTTRTGEASTAGAILLAFAGAVLAGALEATIVGLAQHAVLRPHFPAITRRAWWLGTLLGALAGYILGYLPSTIMSLSQTANPAAAPMTEPPAAVMLLLWAGLGLAAGAVLAFGQYLAMRKSVPGAARWLPANMLAWAVGMPLISIGMDIAFRNPTPAWMVPVIAVTLLVTGTVVGAIHGRMLVKMAAESAAKTGQLAIDKPAPAQ